MEARKWLQNPDNKIPWYERDPYWQKHVESDIHHCPADDIDIIDSFYRAGAKKVEILEEEDTPHRSARFRITLPDEINTLLDLITEIMTMRPDAYAPWSWIDNDRIWYVDFYGTYEI